MKVKDELEKMMSDELEIAYQEYQEDMRMQYMIDMSDLQRIYETYGSDFIKAEINFLDGYDDAMSRYEELDKRQKVYKDWLKANPNGTVGEFGEYWNALNDLVEVREK